MAEREPVKAFLSYSRRDKEFAQRLWERLKSEGIDAWVDWEGIPISSNWMQEIQRAIEGADAFIFIMSPDSLKSNLCVKELETAQQYNKRLIPILFREANYKEMPMALASLNWIYFRIEDDFDSAFSKLLEALWTDYEWMRAHTRLMQRAMEWESKGRDKSFLLRGADLQITQQAVITSSGKEPALTAIQRDYMLASQEANKGLFDRLGFGSASQTSQTNQAQTKAEPVQEPPLVEEKILPVEVGKLFSVSTDQPSGADQLNYTRFADAFATLVQNPEATTPITIGIYGQWGSGKSFLMKKIKEALQGSQLNTPKTWFGKMAGWFKRLFTPRDNTKVDTLVIEFNAWVYSGSEHLWAGLVTHLYREIEKQFGLGMQSYRLMKAVRRLFPKTIGFFCSTPSRA